MENVYTLSVYNTLTARYESVCVSEEVYHVYMRTNWNIEDSNKRFYKHEIQFSSLTGGEDGAFAPPRPRRRFGIRSIPRKKN